MLKTCSVLAGAVLLAASNVATVQAAQTGSVSSQVTHTTSAQSKAMDDLQRAAQRLRETIRMMAQQPPGRDRDQALHDANAALHDAQQAMIDYGPVAQGSTPSAQARATANPQTYDQVMQKLRVATDRLYDAVHAMVSAPAGERRNQAIKDINESLLDSQVAMAWIADQKLTAGSSASTSAHGTTSSRPGGGFVYSK